MRPAIRIPVVVMAAALLLPAQASAHLALRRSAPDSNARLLASPDAVTLWFTQRPQLAFSRITLLGPGGEVALAALVADTGNAVRGAIPSPLARGEYVVRWQSAGADGHAIRGEFRFTVGGTGADSGPAPPPPAAPHVHEPLPEAHTDHPLYRGVRWIEFVALITVLGALSFRHLVLPAAASRGVATSDAADRARRMGQAMLFLYLPAALLRLYAESSALHADGPLEWASLQAMLRTPWGLGWSTGVMGALAALIGWRLARARLHGATIAAILGGILMAVSPALTGHAAGGTPQGVSIAMDAAHVIAAGLWVGGLLMLLVAGVPALARAPDGSGHPAIAAMVNSFHPVALWCAPLTLFTGVSNTWQRIGNPVRMLDSPYGRVLAVKIALFVVVAAFGLHHSARARRRLGSPDATRTFRMSGWAEVAVAAILLAVTTVLIVTPLPSATP